MGEEEKEAIEYFKQKIKNKLPLYEEIYIDGKPYRRNFLQLETNFTEEQANKASVILNLIEKQQKKIEELKDIEADYVRRMKTSNKLLLKQGYISKDKIREFIKEYFPDDEIMECCECFDSNGVLIRKKLKNYWRNKV